MSEKPVIAYTVKTGGRDGLLEALNDLDLDRGDYEAILYPERGRDYSLRSETREGVEQALDAVEVLNSAVVRVWVGDDR